MSEGEAKKYVVRDFDDALAMLDALEEFFEKARKAYERFKRLIKQLGPEESKPRFSFSTGHGRLEDEFMRMVMDEYMKRKARLSHVELTPEEQKEIDGVIDKLRERRVEG